MKNKDRIAKLARDIDQKLKDAHATTELRRDVAALIGEAHGEITNLSDVGAATNAWGRE